jgi:hypothetical protein
MPAHAAFSTAAEESDGARRQAVQMAAVVFAVSVLMMLTGEAVQFGVNLFTAEVLLMAAAVAMLLRTIRKLI